MPSSELETIFRRQEVPCTISLLPTGGRETQDSHVHSVCGAFTGATEGKPDVPAELFQ